MRSWRDPLLAVLSREWAGLLLALLVALLGAVLARGLGGHSGLAVHAVTVALALAMALAALRHLVVLGRARRAHSPPGRLVDIGGHRVHVLAEGEARVGRPPVVWFAAATPAATPSTTCTAPSVTRPGPS